MASTKITNNHHEVISAVGLTGAPEPLFSTNNALNVSGSFSVAGGATAANQTNGTQKTQLVDGSGNVIASTSNALNVAIVSGAAGGTASSFGAAFPATGTAAGATDGTNMRQLQVESSTVFNLRAGIWQGATQATVTGANALKVDGSAVTQPVSGTFWQATQPVSGTVTANAGTNLNTSALALETGGNLATVAGAVIAQEATTSGVKGVTVFGAVTTSKPTYTTAKSDALSLDVNGLLRVSLADTPANTNKFLVTADPITFASAQAVNATLQTQTDTTMVGGVNIKEINAVAPLMGNGVTGTGSQRVTIASDNTAFSVNATLSAETTKVIGTVRTADGAGNLYTTNSTTYTAKFAQDSNLLGTLGTAFSTAGKVDVKGADGDVFVRQTTGTNLHVVTDSTSTTAVTQATAANLNATVVGQATGSAVPANAFYNAGDAATALPTAASAGNLTGAMYDKFGRQVVLPVTIRDLTGTQTTTISASTSETTIVTAAASVFNDLLMLVISNTSASTTTRIDFRDTTGGSILFSLFSPAADTRGFSLSGVVIPQTSVNTNWTAQCATSTTDIRIYAVFAKNK